ncbi:MAG TPA: hypothetical protein VKM72_21410 [Thermoanaerobaculia bacterium]|nr:hypothetical protein [Thermoanaerobaculia bacterium]
MTNRSIAFSLALLASTPLWAQPPAQVEPLTGNVIVATGEGPHHHLLSPDVTLLGQSEFLVTWDLSFERYSGSQLVDFGSAISARKVSLQGQPVGEELTLEPFEQHTHQGLHRLAADASGRFAVLWHELDSSQLLLRRFTSDGTVLETTELEPDSGFFDIRARPALAMDPSGRFSAALAGAPTGLWLQLFDARADPLVDAIHITGRHSPALALAMANGVIILVYQDEATARVQRFNAAGQRLGPAVPVVGRNSFQALPAVAANAEGRFVVAWVGNHRGIDARVFDRSGRKIGPVLRVSRATVYGDNSPHVALDARGNFVVVWQKATSLDGPREIRARLYNRDGVPQGGELVVDPEFVSQFLTDFPPGVAMTPGGNFLVTWPEDFNPDSGLPVVQARLYALLRDDDRCVWRDGVFLCDTAADGDLTHLEHRFGRTGDQPLLADFDGDGIDDPCVRRGTAFVCDTARPGSADLVLRFGGASNPPLAGDLDGDGDDDPCLRRGRAFLCDTAHNGGSAEVRLPLGLSSDEPVLGDVDGDGDDDPCVFRGTTGTFICDTTHDGAPDLTHAVDAHSGDQPLLGDLDGDGDADFCLARGEDLFCDLDRDGVLEEETLATEAGDVLLLGNVDGV